MSKVNFHLQFDDGGRLYGDLPIEIRQTSMALVKRALASQTVELDPGTYVVSTRLPAGREFYQVVNVAAGETTTVTLKPEAPADAASSRRGGIAGLRGSRMMGMEGTTLESLGFGGRDAGPAGLRFWTGNTFQKPSPLKSDVSTAAEIHSNGVRLQIRVGDELLVVQMLQPGAPTVNIVLPAWRSACTLFILRPSAGGGVEVHLADEKADLLVRFATLGQLTQAYTLMTWLSAWKEAVLRTKECDPIVGAVGAYALLRFNDLDDLGAWMEDFAERFAWLPDSLAVQAEYLARVGRHEEAFRCLLELPMRGLPIFSRGLSLAINRLKFYLGSIGKRISTAERHEAMDALDLFDQFRPFVNFDQPITMFTGLDPHQPDAKPLSEIKGGQGLDLSKWF